MAKFVEVKFVDVLGRRRSKILATYVCLHCQNEYQEHYAVRASTKFCSKACKDASQRSAIRCVCRRCDKQFEVTPADIRKGGGKYCSRACAKTPRPLKTCETCSKQFQPFHSTQKGRFCSDRCKNLFQVGERNPNYKAAEVVRYGWDWSETRTKVLERDGHTCQACSETHSKMHVHHIVPYRICRSHDPENLITLCKNCHKKYEFGLQFSERCVTREEFLALVHIPERKVLDG